MNKEEIMKQHATQLVDMMAEDNRDINSVRKKIKEIISDDFDRDFLMFELDHEKIEREYKILNIEYESFKDLMDIRIQESENKKAVAWPNLIGIIINDANNMKKELNAIFDELYTLIKEV